MPRLRTMAFALLFAPLVSSAADTVFANHPFDGSSADPDDGIRTVFTGQQLSLPGFDVYSDRFVFDPGSFHLDGALSFASGLSGQLPSSGANVLVVRDTGPGFNAGSAAIAVAEAVSADGADVFIDHNVSLGVNRLVYSTNLNLNTADLSVLARIESPFGADALASLGDFSAQDFALTSAVPEPASMAMLLLGLTVVAARSRTRAA